MNLGKSFLALCIFFCLHSLAQDNSTNAILGPDSVPAFPKTTEQIKAFFQDRHIPVEMRNFKNGSDIYYFVLAHPYSGIDTTDLYCFAKRDGSFRFFLKAYLWKTPSTRDIRFEADGNFVDVLSKEVTVLKICPPK